MTSGKIVSWGNSQSWSNLGFDWVDMDEEQSKAWGRPRHAVGGSCYFQLHRRRWQHKEGASWFNNINARGDAKYSTDWPNQNVPCDGLAVSLCLLLDSDQQVSQSSFRHVSDASARLSLLRILTRPSENSKCSCAYFYFLTFTLQFTLECLLAFHSITFPVCMFKTTGNIGKLTGFDATVCLACISRE